MFLEIPFNTVRTWQTRNRPLLIKTRRIAVRLTDWCAFLFFEHLLWQNARLDKMPFREKRETSSPQKRRSDLSLSRTLPPTATKTNSTVFFLVQIHNNTNEKENMPMMESPHTPESNTSSNTSMISQRRMSGSERRSRRRPRRPASFPAAIVPPTRRQSSEELAIATLDELEQACSDAATAADDLVGLSQRSTSLIVERSAGELSPMTPTARRSISLDPAMSLSPISATISRRPPIVPSCTRPGAYNTKGRPADIPPWLSDSSIEQRQRDRRLRLSEVDRMSWKTLARWLEDESKNNNNATTQQQESEQQQSQLPVATPIVSSTTKNDDDDDDHNLAVVAEVVATTTTTTTRSA